MARGRTSLAVLVIVLSLLASKASQAQVVITPNTSPPPLQNVQTITIDAGPGAHFDPHVDGSLISYTTNLFDGTGAHIQFFRVGVDSSPQQIPFGPNTQDFLSDAGGTRVAYAHVDNNGTHIYLFDTAQPTGPSNPIEINPQAQAGCSISKGDCFNRFSPALGGNTLAYIDLSLGINGDLVVYDLNTNTTTRLTNDSETDQNATVSPDGNTVVWEHCPVDTNHCDIWQAVNTGGSWAVSAVSSDPAQEDFPDTNGSVVVYASDRPAGAADVFFRQSGGIEHDLQLPGIQAATRIAGDLVLFAGNQGGVYDIYLYQISTNRLWNVTNTQVDDLLSDISVLPNGDVIAVYESTELSASRPHLYATTFRVPPAATDTDPPTISIVTPAGGASYPINSVVNAQYSCADSGSGIASCVGTVASGAAISTSSAGPKTLVVNAQDVAGNAATRSVNYSVGYNICPLYDSTKAKKSGSTYPIQIQLCDANGQNVSSSSIVVHAANVTQVSTNAPGTLDDAGNSNPDFDFRYDATLDGYVFNLKTTGFATGTYTLGFTAPTDPVVHVAPFQIK